MNHFDYSEARDLFEKYIESFFPLFSEDQKNLADELSNKLKDLEGVSMEIVDTNSRLFIIENPSPNINDEIEFMGFKIKLQRADPNIPIMLDNATRAYQKSFQNPFSGEEVKKMENKLARLASEFYIIANRIAHIAKKLPALESFKANTVRIIRSQLLEHPEGKSSGVTYDTFSYSKNDGPCIKGFRVGARLEHMDKGFKNNNEEFLAEFENVVSKSLK